MFKTVMIVSAVVSGILTAVLICVYRLFPFGWMTSLAVTAGTFFYHFAMRLCVGAVLTPLRKHDPHSRWFREKAFEAPLYRTLRVRKWKAFAPTYDPDSFDVTKHSLEEIVAEMCHSELVHEIIALLSFLPLAATILFGAFPVFLITSLAAAMIDLSFVVIQRYNRPKLLRVINRRNRNV